MCTLVVVLDITAILSQHIEFDCLILLMFLLLTHMQLYLLVELILGLRSCVLFNLRNGEILVILIEAKDGVNY